VARPKPTPSYYDVLQVSQNARWSGAFKLLAQRFPALYQVIVEALVR
jgi:hypothetical protein